MYNVAKLSPESKAFLSNLPTINKGNQEVTLLALAKAVANVLNLPSSPVENPPVFYSHSVYTEAREIISLINELTVIDLGRAKELVKTHWVIRYNILFPRTKIFVTSSLPSESHFMGFGSLLSPKDSAFIQGNTETLVDCLNGFSKMLQEMSAEDLPVESNF